MIVNYGLTILYNKILDTCYRTTEALANLLRYDVTLDTVDLP